MKSLRDEIRTDVRDKEDGFDFIVSAGVPRSELASFGGSRMRTISSEHREDFTAAPLGVPETSHARFGEWGNAAISLKNERFYHG